MTRPFLYCWLVLVNGTNHTIVEERKTHQVIPELGREQFWHSVEVNRELSGLSQVIHY